MCCDDALGVGRLAHLLQVGIDSGENNGEAQGEDEHGTVDDVD